MGAFIFLVGFGAFILLGLGAFIVFVGLGAFIVFVGFGAFIVFVGLGAFIVFVGLGAFIVLVDFGVLDALPRFGVLRVPVGSGVLVPVGLTLPVGDAVPVGPVDGVRSGATGGRVPPPGASLAAEGVGRNSSACSRKALTGLAASVRMRSDPTRAAPELSVGAFRRAFDKGRTAVDRRSTPGAMRMSALSIGVPAATTDVGVGGSRVATPASDSTAVPAVASRTSPVVEARPATPPRADPSAWVCARAAGRILGTTNSSATDARS